MTNKVILDRAIIENLPALKLIAVTATGTNNIDLSACREQRVQVINATDYGTQSVAEHTLMLMLALSRQLRTYLAANEDRAWSRSPFFCDLRSPISTLHGKTLTIVGRGTLGSAVGRLAEAFGMRVLFAEHRNASTTRPNYVRFNQALAEADFLSLHCPLNDNTHHLINEKTLALLKPTAYLINTGRGDLVDEVALLESLKSGAIGGAALDVASTEPPAQQDPIWSLAQQPTVLVTPHIAWAADEAMRALIDQIMGKVAAFAQGNPIMDLAQK